MWREDAANYDGDAREELYAGLYGADQHHTQTFIGQIYDNLSKKQPGSDPKFFYWGQENGNVFKDILTHGAMAVSAYSAHPEKALEVYDLLRNDEESYRLINYGIEGTDYVITDDGKLGYPEGYDSSTDSLGSNFWAGRMDEFELDRVTDAPNKAGDLRRARRRRRGLPVLDAPHQQGRDRPDAGGDEQRAHAVRPAAGIRQVRRPGSGDRGDARSSCWPPATRTLAPRSRPTWTPGSNGLN